MPINIPFESEEFWLSKRREDITSTESAALFGLSPYMTEFELYYHKTSDHAQPFEQSDRMKWGNRLEPVIAAGVAEDLGLKIRKIRRYMRHDSVPRMGSSFDYEIISHERGRGLMEIKNVDRLIYMKDWDDKEAPPHIEVQVQHEMEVADVDWCLIVPLIGGNDAKPFYRERDRTVGAEICNAITRFWQRVESGQEPLPDYARDAEFVIKMHQAAGVNVLNCNDEKLEQLICDYDRINAEIKNLEEIKQARKAEILDIIGDDVGKVLAGVYTLSCGMTKDTPPTIITPEMVGQEIGGRKGYRNFRLNRKTK